LACFFSLNLGKILEEEAEEEEEEEESIDAQHLCAFAI
jgi:hypothetical protein